MFTVTGCKERNKLEKVEIKIKKTADCEDINTPEYMTSHASGMDVYAAVDTEIILEPGKRELIPTGIAVAIPQGFELQIRPRSGLAVKHGITVLNSPGTIDSDYRGEIKIILINLGDEPFSVRRGDRIAQMVVQKVFQAQWSDVVVLPETDRDDGGFGHTGK